MASQTVTICRTRPAPAKLSSADLMKMEDEKAAHNYHPIPVVFSRAEGIMVWDPEGKQYFDCLSAYSAVNQGHCHPAIVRALTDQASRCTLSSRAFFNDVFPIFAEYITSLLGYEMVLPMNTGAEAVETAMKLARKWAYEKKGVPKDEAILISCKGCFHGRTLAIVSMSDDPSAYEGFGPKLPGLMSVTYNDAEELEKVLEQYGDRVAGFLVEPIQGEAGVKVPDDGYLKRCYEACKKHNVLFIADEIQSGLGRTGKMLAIEHSGVKPDVVILGKALAGGVLPMSAVLSSKEIMLVFKPGQHGSTYGGNPLASAVGLASLKALVEEKMVENSERLGHIFRAEMAKLKAKYPFIIDIRGKGLFNAIELDANYSKTAWEFCIMLKEAGVLAKPTHDTTIRLSPPLIITEAQLRQIIEIIEQTTARFDKATEAEIAALLQKNP
jgi:ornithine--oxo-acid transaminase